MRTIVCGLYRSGASRQGTSFGQRSRGHRRRGTGQHLFGLFDPQIVFEQHIADGQEVREGDIVFVVSGPSGKLLSIERLVLNYMQRLSGIASHSKVYAEAVKGTGTQILDTRKTTPGLRILEKWAVQLGGCSNHRMGLYDMIMLKDNHIDFCGSVARPFGPHAPI